MQPIRFNRGIEARYCRGPSDLLFLEWVFPLLLDTQQRQKHSVHICTQGLLFCSANTICFLASCSVFVLRQSECSWHVALRNTALTVSISRCRHMRRHCSVVVYQRGKWVHEERYCLGLEWEAESQENKQLQLVPNFLWLERCLAAYGTQFIFPFLSHL